MGCTRATRRKTRKLVLCGYGPCTRHLFLHRSANRLGHIQLIIGQLQPPPAPVETDPCQRATGGSALKILTQCICFWRRVVEVRRTRRPQCLAKSMAVAVAVLLSAALLSRPNLAPAAERAPSDGVAYGTKQNSAM